MFNYFRTIAANSTNLMWIAFWILVLKVEWMTMYACELYASFDKNCETPADAMVSVKFIIVCILGYAILGGWKNYND
jgi:hypothetical protein